MKRIHLIIFNFFVISCFCLTAVHAQKVKKHTERFTVNEEVNIHVNTTHTNVKFETWDKNEVEVTFTLKAEENAAELFKEWNFEATGNSSKINVESSSRFNFNIPNFEFEFDMKDLNLNMEHLNFEMPELNFDIDNMVSDIMEGLNLEDMPPSPFGKDTDFNGDKYRENPDDYLKKMNDKHGTQVTRKEVDQYLDNLEEWAENIDVRVNESTKNLEGLDERIKEQTKGITESVEKWEKENEARIKEMTEKIEIQMENMEFDRFQNFNYFDQERSNIKKSIHIKMPTKAKLNLNIRYGEVTLAENLRNINADLNYASLSANTITGKDTDISASFAPVFVNHWQNGRLKLTHCNDLTIKKASKINLNAQGTDIVIGVLLNSASIHNAYGDLEIQKLGADLKDLNLVLDFGTALLHLPSNAFDLTYTGNAPSSFSLPQKCKVISDTKEGSLRIVKAYKQKQNSGQELSIRANYGDLKIR